MAILRWQVDTTHMKNAKIPYYHQAIDWPEFVKKYPPPREFVETIYTWDRNRIEKMQATRFVEAVSRAWKNPFYKEIWSQAGLVPGDIKSIADIGKLPVVSSSDFKLAIEKSPPWGKHQGVDEQTIRSQPLKIQTSGGTTGKPRPTFHGPIEWEINGMSPARALLIQGGAPGDLMQIPMTCYTGNAAWSYYYACHAWLGMVPITTGAGSVTPSRKQIDIAREWGTNIWLAGPYHVQLAQVAQDELGFDVRDLKTKFLHGFLGSDQTGKFRAELEEIWGCDVYDNYGTHEIGLPAFECREKCGMHFQEDLGYVEIVNPSSGDPVDMQAGEAGDLVYTSFYREHPPLIRYNLKDRVRIIDYGKKCACGSYLLRRGPHEGRSDDMVKLRGTNIHPESCQDAITNTSFTTGEYLCVVDTLRNSEGVYLSEEMTVKVEYQGPDSKTSDFKSSLEHRLKADLGVRVAVEVVPAGSLTSFTNVDGSEMKKRRLLDKRTTVSRS